MSDFFYPNVRRKRRGNGSEVEEDAISLHQYCAGRKWHSWHDYSQQGFPVAIGDQLFRFLDSWDGSEYDRDTAEYILIQALDDHLGTWYEYSRLDCPLFKFLEIYRARGINGSFQFIRDQRLSCTLYVEPVATIRNVKSGLVKTY